MKTVAVLGGGPAGASAAERLARAGLNTMVFDEKLAWEKPCGGGLTYKAYEQYPYLIDNDTPKKLIHETVVNSQGAGEAKMNLTQPLLIYSRLDLNRMLLQRAERAGAALEQTRVLGIEQQEKGWRLRTRNGTAEADFLIVATGARNPLREVGTEWGTGDTITALGYFVPGVRHLMALVAGSSQMRYPVFAGFAYTGGIIWSLTFILMGYSLGDSWPQIRSHRFILALVAAFILAAILVFWYVKSKSTKAKT